MTLSTPVKIVVACFAVAALMATAMSGSKKSVGLKGSRKLQINNAASDLTISSILANSNTILSSVMPVPGAGTMFAGNIVAISALNSRPGDATFTNSVLGSASPILSAVMPPAGAGTFFAGTIASNAALNIRPGDGTLTANSIIDRSNVIFGTRFGP